METVKQPNKSKVYTAQEKEALFRYNVRRDLRDCTLWEAIERNAYIVGGLDSWKATILKLANY